MAYFNNADDTTSYPTSFTFDEFDEYPIPSQTSSAGEGGVMTHVWGMGGEPNQMVSSTRSLRSEASFESVTSVTSYTPPAQGRGQLFPVHYWPTTGPYAQPYHPGTVSWDNSFTSAMGLDFSTAVPTLSSVPLSYWGDSESGPSTSTSYTNVQTPHQPSTGLTRTGTMTSWRFQPHGASHARPVEHENAVAGPSNLVPIPFVKPPTTYPSGGLSETTADAENDQISTEEDAAPTTRRPRGSGRTRMWRFHYQQDVHRLRAWAKGWEGLKKLPTHESALDIALQVVQTKRAPVYDTPRLARGTSVKRTAKGKTAPDAEHRRRKDTRGLNEELSGHYLLEANQATWRCPELLTRVLNDIERARKSSD